MLWKKNTEETRPAKNKEWGLDQDFLRIMTLKEFMDRFRGIFPECCEDFFLVNKYKIEEDAPNWCCRRTLLLNLLGRVIIRKYVTFLWRHLLPSKLNLSKRFIVSALLNSGSPESSFHIAGWYPQVHRKSCENRLWMWLKQDLTSDTFPPWITQKSKIERV